MRDLCITYIMQHRFFRREFLMQCDDEYVLELYFATRFEQETLPKV